MGLLRGCGRRAGTPARQTSELHFLCPGEAKNNENGMFGAVATSLPVAQTFRIREILRKGSSLRLGGSIPRKPGQKVVHAPLPGTIEYAARCDFLV